LGDALSTALFCMSLEDGNALVASLDGAEAMWILPNGEKRYSDGFSDYMIRP
jgi:thiamine biosynthesis lipoprotein